MANMGKQKVSSKQVPSLGQKKSIFSQGKFPESAQNATATSATTDLSEYPKPQPGEMIANVMQSSSTSRYSLPPNYVTDNQLTAPKRQDREVNTAPVNQLKAPPRQSNLLEPTTKPIQKQENSIPNQTGLPDNLKAGVESLSGYSLDNVRVHYNSPKPAQLQALAYTQGTDIHVAPGQEKHLPHETWHVVQQMQGRVKPTMQMKGIQMNDDAGLEKEADVMGTSSLRKGQELIVHNLTHAVEKDRGRLPYLASGLPSSSLDAGVNHPLRIQRGTPESIQCMGETLSIKAGSNSPSAYALRATGIPELYWRFIFPGGTVYRRTNADPIEIFKNGWMREGYEDLVRHTDTDQGRGSNWIATTEDLTGMDERYGIYAFEIEIQWHQGVVVNPAYEALTKHRNPHADQQEVAVWRRIAPEQVKAVWVPKGNGGNDKKTWADSYERYTRASYGVA